MVYINPSCHRGYLGYQQMAIGKALKLVFL